MRTILAALLATSITASPLAAQNPVRWTVASTKPVTVPAAGIARVNVNAVIDKGWRVYSLSQKKGGPYAMSIALVPGSKVSIAGPVVSPKPDAKYDAEFKMITETHSGSTTFMVPVRAPSSAGTATANIRIRYQACSDKFCLPPRNAVLPVTLRVVSAK